MAFANESAASLRWLSGNVGELLDHAWSEVRDRMRVPTGQTVIAMTDWISDPWVAKGIAPAGPFPLAAAMYDPPEEVDAWPDFHVSTTLSTLPLPFTPTLHGAIEELIAATSAGSDDRGDAAREFLASEKKIASHGDEHMIFGDQVRSWVLASVGT
jgi:uncharacterized protein (DUF1684 family)